ncbi:orotidine 5'-phosphate decarboxylase / HUMPS family protein [Sporolactobacillus laevolacticus]|uniref:orotidine 5'-phosphate decarboxylase / HUMPS family protein n=1 Tax=Sporolactobacillus laevolacticus TaxID=33018 RepID=UPI0025B2D28B|nr:orotidine 5'-phosphate decarboxylase / HUMPS family protein [Sporolactobacillus laevolacticus]MDN3956626.1 orotidine 5'-phosphate decarboxylase / HUMPS family protein [Sporolactobacillus laevolacticus]
MKLQIAIDRVPLETAKGLMQQLAPYTDVLEAGTSLIKDYGVTALGDLKEAVSDTQLLGDIKTIDEGAYEFRQGYRHGADLLTVMGASSVETIRKCYEVAEEYGKEMMIDLLECTPKKVEEIIQFPNAIYCLHTSVDQGATADPNGDVLAFKKAFPSVKRIAIAGGINLTTAAALSASAPEIVIVGSGITKAEDPIQAAKQFRKVMEEQCKFSM